MASLNTLPHVPCVFHFCHLILLRLISIIPTVVDLIFESISRKQSGSSEPRVRLVSVGSQLLRLSQPLPLLCLVICSGTCEPLLRPATTITRVISAFNAFKVHPGLFQPCPAQTHTHTQVNHVHRLLRFQTGVYLSFTLYVCVFFWQNIAFEISEVCMISACLVFLYADLTE